jgi:hypothetical protein
MERQSELAVRVQSGFQSRQTRDIPPRSEEHRAIVRGNVGKGLEVNLAKQRRAA